MSNAADPGDGGGAPLAVSCGDPAGIGGEILAAAWRILRETGPAFVLIGDAEWAAAQGVDAARIASPAEAAAVFPKALPVLHQPLARPDAPLGRAEPANAAAVIASIETGAALAMSGEVRGLVTLPISKKALYDGAGFAHPGHTEFLAHLTGAARPVMMLAGPSLKVIPATIHIPLAQVPQALTTDLLVETLRIARADLRARFGLAEPRIAVSGLNPHAGEGGAMGREEIGIIAPALEVLRDEGADIRGPLPADTMFHARARAGYDAAVCMYHDQALIPIKALDFDLGVNVTLGLPIVRTSPDHGTAYDIAGKGLADPSSLVAAIRMADEMAARGAGDAAGRASGGR